MKKITVLFVLITFAIVSSAFAGAWTAGEGTTMYGISGTTAPTASTGTAIGKLSNNVQAKGFTVSTTDGYAISTRHDSGSQSYGTAHDSTSIWMVKSDSLAAMTKTGTGDFVSTWTEL
ncbi:MAG: hypothetical protein IH613_15935 [Desulfuromonadales bacterium]|nr:hypothetical protein [Desulfuromonadales bacterium]